MKENIKTGMAAGTCQFIFHLSVNIWGSQGLHIKSLEMHKGIKGMKINQCLERIYILRLKFYNIENNHFGFFLKHEKAGRKHNSRNQ